MVKLDGLRPSCRFVTRTCLKINVKNENIFGKNTKQMCGFLCSSYFVCLSLTEGLRIFHHFTDYQISPRCAGVYYCVMPGNYRQGSNTPRRAEPSIQFIRGIKSRDKPSSENLLLCYRQSLSGMLLLYVSIIGADI